ncbi:putative fatty acyl-CoA reductase CG5065 [Anthonomus grandis grandis]|uniref:putative fatty acyl-CoA reductase CG5065 n=1 Tax=Anthonomus grandis grandis TaxID=2921223 RepID=UPI002166B9F1|nr:putative fatty acyl-CoA reductase CG5065 [Anthonomus grandis grandis]
MESHERSKIAAWYDNRSVFITGGSGFMGKVMVEKLLYTCDGIKNIYILLRGKRGRTPHQRVEDMWKLPVFDRLRQKDPSAIQKIIPLPGDLYTEGLGLSSSDLKQLIENVSVIFHMAATLKLEATLKDAVEQNTSGTVYVLDIAKQMKKLDAFCHFSTAYCSADIEVFEERVYEFKDNPREVIDIVRWMKPDALEVATKKIIEPHPNTYTYSKRLAESLVANEKDHIPVCIIRPAVVCPAALEPVPGWVDSLNGPMGLLVAAGKGVLRSMHCIGSNKAQVIPVDFAINASIVIAYKLGSEKRSEEVPVYNLTQDGVIRITMGEIIDKGRDIVYANPFEMQVWYPDGDIRASKIMHTICCIFMHWLPALLIDFIMLLIRQKRFMIRIQKKIHQGLELLQFFTVREWNFASQRFLALWDEMDERDRKAFPMDFHALPIESYLEISVLGARQYCMKEPLSSLPRCRIQQKVLYVVHKLFVFFLYYYLFYFLSLWIPPVKILYDLLWKTIDRIPYFGQLPVS